MIFSQQVYRRLFYAAILVLGLAWTAASAAPKSATTNGKIPAPQTGFLAPDFSLTTLTGKSVHLADLRGKVVLVNIWASWCPPCQAEMPAIQQVYDEYKGDGFVALAVDSTVQDRLPDVEKFVTQHNLSLPILLDQSGEVTRSYQVRSLPTSFFIGRDGLIHDVELGGPMAEALLRSRVEQLLKKKP